MSNHARGIHRDLTKFENRPSGEINIKSIRDFEEQIKEHEAAIVKLKRVRNSLLNVSKLPPEVLGDVFRWNVTVNDTFGGLGERSHNFLLVCRHWFGVASCTPEVWSFWGSSLEDWKKQHLQYPSVPLDLVLNGEKGEPGTLDRST